MACSFRAFFSAPLSRHPFALFLANGPPLLLRPFPRLDLPVQFLRHPAGGIPARGLRPLPCLPRPGGSAARSSRASTRYASADGAVPGQHGGLFAGAVGIAGPLAHLGQPGVRLGYPAVGGHGRLIKPLGFEQQPAVKIIFGLGGQLLRSLARREAASREASIWSSISAAWRKATASKLRAMRSSGSALVASALQSCRDLFVRPFQARAAPGPRCRWAAAAGTAPTRSGRRRLSVALQAHRQIEVVVGCIGIGGHRLAEERNAVVALAADRDPLVVQDLGQRQNARHAIKRLLGLGIVAGKQQRQSAIESRPPARRARAGVAPPTLAKAAAASSYCWLL
jgi:hypothetical protein